MIHFFVVDLTGSGDYYNMAIDGGTKKECEEYLHSLSDEVRFYKSVNSQRTYARYKDLGFGKLFYCKYLHKIPKGIQKDTRHRCLST